MLFRTRHLQTPPFFRLQFCSHCWSNVGCLLPSKIHPTSNNKHINKLRSEMHLARTGSDRMASSGAQIWNNTCPEITSKLYQHLVSKMSQSWLQEWSVLDERIRVSWPFARARSSQMDCDTSRPQGSRPIRSSPLEPNGL